MKKLNRIIVLWSLVFSLSCALFAKADDMIYLIPAGYTGGVFILYDKESATMAETLADGTVIYRVPQDGLLIVKPPKKAGPYNFKYFYVDDNDRRTEIKYLEPGFEIRKPNEPPSNNPDRVTISEEERDTEIFTMNHRKISFSFRRTPMLLFAFSVGLPKDGGSIYDKTNFRHGKLESEVEKKLREEVKKE